MDILSHGLWGGAAFGRKNRKTFWLAFAIGLAPDVFSFGIFFVARLLGFYGRVHWGGRPDADQVPAFVGHLYDVTHSLVVFAAAFLLLWFVFRRPIWVVGAWGLHVVVDIFSHSFDFFPTPFLWPLSNFKVNAISWGDPRIFLPNVLLLAIFYIWFFLAKRKYKK